MSPPVESAAHAALDALVGEEVSRGLATTQLGGSADDTWVPVSSALAGLLPGGALRRGSVVTVVGSSSLLLALLAEASAAGSWCAEVGTAGLGSAAAAEMGVALDRFVRVPRPGDRWPETVAALLDGFDIVVVHPWVDAGPAAGQRSGGQGRSGQAVRAAQAARRLTARARERRAVVLATWPWEGAALGLSVAVQRWHGLGLGHGCLAAREAEVVAVGRGSAVRPRRSRLWLPGPDGRVVSYEEGLAALGDLAPRPRRIDELSAPAGVEVELSGRTRAGARAGSDRSWPPESAGELSGRTRAGARAGSDRSVGLAG